MKNILGVLVVTLSLFFLAAQDVQAKNELINEVPYTVDAKGKLVKLQQKNNVTYTKADIVKTKTGFDIRIYDKEGNYLNIAKKPIKVSVTTTSMLVEIDGKVLSVAKGFKFTNELRLGHIDTEKKFTSVPTVYDGHSLVFYTRKPLNLSLIPYVKSSFKDIAKNGSRYEIERLFYYGVTNGTSPTKFDVNKKIPKRQFITMLSRATGVEPTKNTTKFTNIKGSNYEMALRGLVDNNIYITKDTKFKPSENITRQEAIGMIYKAYIYYGGKPHYKGVTTAKQFKDYAKIDSSYVLAVGTLAELGVINKGTINFNPQGYLTRSQVAKIMHKTFNAVGIYN